MQGQSRTRRAQSGGGGGDALPQARVAGATGIAGRVGLVLVVLVVLLAALGCPARAHASAAPPSADSSSSRWESPAALSRAAEEFVRSHLPAEAAADHVRLHAGRVAARFPACAPQRLLALPFGDPSPYGAQTVQLRCEGPRMWSVYLQVSVDWPQQVVVAAHAISPGHTLRPSDLQVLQRDRAGLPPGALQSESQADGRVLRFGVAAGQSITESMLSGPRLIHYGQAVSLIAEGDGVRLVALGIALQDGSQGQTVLVRNAQSGKVVSGVVDAHGNVVAALFR